MSVALLIAIVVGFAIGIGIDVVTNQGLYTIVWLQAIALLLAVVWRRSTTTSPRIALFSVGMLCVALGLFRTELHQDQFTDPLRDHVGSDNEFVGRVIQEPDRRTSIQLLTVEYDTARVLVSTDRSADVRYGDQIRVTGTLSYPEEFQTDLGRTFDYPMFLRAKGIEYTVGFAEVVIVERGGGNAVVSLLLQVKSVFTQQLDQILFEPAGSLADGLLLGINQGLGEELEEDFRRAGIIHIVVLSGYNIMLIVSFVLFLLSFFCRPRTKLFVGLAAITAFVLIVGLSATVVRAGIMAAIFLIAQTYGKTYDVFRSLLVAGLCMLILNPYLLFDIGFQLSFMATLGLLLALPWLPTKGQPELLTTARGYVVATIATQVAVLPLLIYHIGEVSLVAVVVNVLVLPVVPFAMLGSFVSALLSFGWFELALGFGYITELLLQYIIKIAELFSNLSFATVKIGHVGFWGVMFLYAGLGLLYWYMVNYKNSASSTIADWRIEDEDCVRPVS